MAIKWYPFDKLIFWEMKHSDFILVLFPTKVGKCIPPSGAKPLPKEIRLMFLMFNMPTKAIVWQIDLH